jgi:hypothetical protein
MGSLKLAIVVAILAPIAGTVLAAVTLPPASTPEGYVCRLLINEVPFPGEKGYRSEEDTMTAMNQLLHVLDGRLKRVPNPYLQVQIAATKADDIVDVITAGGVKGQFDGFYRDPAGNPAMVDRVGARIDNLVKIAGQGQPGKFARLLNHAADISTRYVGGQFDVADRFDGVRSIEGIPATGGAYSWMADEMRFSPGGNFLRISDGQQGALGGNRFFTLRKEPK